MTVSLRPLELPDADVLAGWASDLEFCRAAGWSTGLSFDHYQRFHQRLITAPPAPLVRLGAVDEGALVGYVDLHGDELGFVIGVRSRWGQGLGRQAAAAGLAWGFDRLGLHEIWAEALDANRRSIRILQGLGMHETGKGAEGEYLGQTSFYRQFAIKRPA